MLLKDCAGADRATIILLKADLRRAGRIRYTGRTHDANKLVHIMPLYTAFVCGHVDYFREMYGYELRRDTPGQKAHIFGPFRDKWLPQALRELRAEENKVKVDDVEENQRLRKNVPCIQGVVGWEWAPGPLRVGDGRPRVGERKWGFSGLGNKSGASQGSGTKKGLSGMRRTCQGCDEDEGRARVRLARRSAE
jgi:hypothetical protein